MQGQTQGGNASLWDEMSRTSLSNPKQETHGCNRIKHVSSYLILFDIIVTFMGHCQSIYHHISPYVQCKICKQSYNDTALYVPICSIKNKIRNVKLFPQREKLQVCSLNTKLHNDFNFVLLLFSNLTPRERFSILPKITMLSTVDNT